MPNFGLGEWLIVLLIILVLFGATRVPALMKGLGKGVREFKKGVSGEDEEEEEKDKKEEGKK
jgi:sec-independent protein translocase protein TatA